MENRLEGAIDSNRTLTPKRKMLCSIIWASSILLALCDSGAVNIRIMVQQFYCGESRFLYFEFKFYTGPKMFTQRSLLKWINPLARNLLRCSGSGDDFQEETYPFRVLRRQGPSAVRCQPNQVDKFFLLLILESIPRKWGFLYSNPVGFSFQIIGI